LNIVKETSTQLNNVKDVVQDFSSSTYFSILKSDKYDIALMKNDYTYDTLCSDININSGDLLPSNIGFGFLSGQEYTIHT
jgi:hypothetical protein